MSDITADEQQKYINEALEQIGFEDIMDMYVKDIGDKKIVVDLSAGTSVSFQVGKDRIDTDDEAGTLAHIKQVIMNARDGRMPSQTEPDMHYNKDMPAELVHNTAAPICESFQPQGMMIMDIQPGLAEMGAIKIGGRGEERKGKNGQPYRLPVKYDHFTIRTKQKCDDGEYIIDPIMKKWGYSGTVEDGPVELDIYLLYNDPTANFLTSYRQYKGGKCMCSGNGIEAVKEDGTNIKCNTETCTFFKSKACKPNGILSVILKDAPTLGGVYKFRTTSYNSIRQILSSMFLIQSATGGYLAHIPLKMTLTPKTVNPIDSPTAQTAYIVNIVFHGNAEDLHKATIELVKERASMRTEILQIEAQARRALCAPETAESIMEIEDEFYPDVGE